MSSPGAQLPRWVLRASGGWAAAGQRGAQADSSLPSLPQDQKFNYTWLRLLRHRDLCVAPAGTTGALGLRPCAGWESSLAWQHSSLAAARPELVSGLGGGGPTTHTQSGMSPPWGPEPGGPLVSPKPAVTQR